MPSEARRLQHPIRGRSGSSSASDQSDLVKVWTIQTSGAWQRFQESGLLRADERYIEPLFLKAYQWLVTQLSERVGPPPRGVRYPVWVWYQYESARKPRPDLRHSAHLAKGETGVRLACQVSRTQLLLSDFVAWHYVLNDWYFGADQPESNEPDEAARQESWFGIFELDRPDLEETNPTGRADKAIQGVLWELRLDQVRAVQPFTAR